MKIRISILLVVMAVFAVPSFAQYDDREIMYDDGGIDEGGGGGGWVDTYSYQNGSYFDNPCTTTADWAWYTYDLSLEQEGKEALSNLDLLFNEQTTIGGSYSVADTSQSDVTYKEPLEIRQYRRANWYDNFHLVTVMRFDPATRQTTLSMEAVCSDGTPNAIE
jgi:hypothetical protein